MYVQDCSALYNYNPNFRIIVILRNPIDRCISHYHFRRRLDNYQGDFESFLEDYPSAIEWSLYGKYLSRYLEVFPIGQVLLVEFDYAVNNVECFKEKLAAFLEIDACKFKEGSGPVSYTHLTLPTNREV